MVSSNLHTCLFCTSDNHACEVRLAERGMSWDDVHVRFCRVGAVGLIQVSLILGCEPESDRLHHLILDSWRQVRAEDVVKITHPVLLEPVFMPLLVEELPLLPCLGAVDLQKFVEIKGEAGESNHVIFPFSLF